MPHLHPYFVPTIPFKLTPLDVLRDLNTPCKPPNPTQVNRMVLAGPSCAGGNRQAGGSITRPGWLRLKGEDSCKVRNQLGSRV